jgi:hypothetical protein
MPALSHVKHVAVCTYQLLLVLFIQKLTRLMYFRDVIQVLLFMIPNYYTRFCNIVARRYGSFREFSMHGWSFNFCLLWDAPTRIFCSAAFRITLETFVYYIPSSEIIINKYSTLRDLRSFNHIVLIM